MGCTLVLYRSFPTRSLEYLGDVVSQPADTIGIFYITSVFPLDVARVDKCFRCFFILILWLICLNSSTLFSFFSWFCWLHSTLTLYQFLFSMNLYYLSKNIVTNSLNKPNELTEGRRTSYFFESFWLNTFMKCFSNMVSEHYSNLVFQYIHSLSTFLPYFSSEISYHFFYPLFSSSTGVGTVSGIC